MRYLIIALLFVMGACDTDLANGVLNQGGDQAGLVIPLKADSVLPQDARPLDTSPDVHPPDAAPPPDTGPPPDTPPPVCGDCDDGDPCTEEVCDDGECLSTYICECEEDGDCDDENGCTEDSCEAGTCIYEGSLGCECDDDEDCDDGDECTTDICHQGKCATLGESLCPCDLFNSLYLPDDCTQDDNPCTEHLCVPPEPGDLGPEGICVAHDVNWLCDDGDPCTQLDQCKKGVCGGKPLCDDMNGCTVDVCIGDGEGCAFEPVDCDDGDPCTEDKCNSMPPLGQSFTCTHYFSSGDPACP